MKLIKHLEEATVSIQEKGRVVSVLDQEYQKLLKDSNEIYKEMQSLQSEFMKKVRELSNKQEVITKKMAAIQEEIGKYVK